MALGLGPLFFIIAQEASLNLVRIYNFFPLGTVVYWNHCSRKPWEVNGQTRKNHLETTDVRVNMGKANFMISFFGLWELAMHSTWLSLGA